MLGIKDNAGAIVIKGRGIKLTLDSTQEEIQRAIKRVPKLKESGFVIELTEKQVKERQTAKAKLAPAKNESVTK